MDQTNLLDGGKNIARPGEVCSIDLKVHSQGFFENGLQDFLSYSLPRLQLQISLIFILTQSLHLLFKRFNFPRSFSEILAGIILGNTILGHILGASRENLFPDEDVLLDILTKLGFMFFMFLVGVKMDPSMVLKTGRKGMSIGICAAVAPVLVGNFISNDKYLGTILAVYQRPAVRAVVRVISLAPFPVIAGLLIDLKIMNSELGRLCLASALISDIINVGINAFSGSYRIYMAGFGLPISMITLVQNMFVALAAVSTRPLFLRIIKLTPEGKPVKNSYIALICCGVIALAIASDTVGLTYHFGPFLMGLVLPAGPDRL